jgi:hypothetical protein
MAWKLQGTYFENCNCDFACPCTVTSLTAGATYDRCQVILAFHLDSGEIDGVDVGGLSVAVVADTPKQMTDGNWRLGAIIDDKASKEQHDKLVGVFSGQMGGPMAALAPLIGEVLGIESGRITYSEQDGRHNLKIGDEIDVAVEDFVPSGLDKATKLVSVAHPVTTTVTVGQPTRSRIKAFGMEFHNEGRSAFSGPFAWQG